MSSELEERIKGFTNEYLIEQYTRKRDEYTEEALGLMKQECISRSITDEDLAKAAAGPSVVEMPHYTKDAFVPLENGFSQVDMLLVQAMLRDAGIPFLVTVPTESSSMIPIETQSSLFFVVHVLKDRLDEARTIIGEHFEQRNGLYAAKHSQGKDRLLSFNFQDVALTPAQMHEAVEVEFSSEETEAIVAYADRLVGEAEAVEARLERFLFYIDNIEELCERLRAKGGQHLLRADLLTILEILQVYCAEETFPQSMIAVAEGILDFLAG